MIQKEFLPFAFGAAAFLLMSGCQQSYLQDQSLLTRQALPGSVTQEIPSSLQISAPLTQENGTIAPNSFRTKNIEDNKPYYKVNVSYPVTGNQTVNANINALINAQVNPFVEDALKSAAEAPGPYTLFISFKSNSFSENVLSFVFMVDIYTGGAHPNHFVLTKTFDMKTGTEITLDDIFYPDSAYLHQISEKTYGELSKTLGQDTLQDMLESGTSPDPKNYDSFSLEAGKITFYFDPYDVAPYAAGPQEVTFHLSDFGNIVQKAFGGTGEDMGSAMGKAGIIPTGTIEGSMGYPSEGIPPSIVVCADNLGTGETACTDVRINAAKYKYGIGYKLSVPVGDYYVYEKVNKGSVGDFDTTYKAYYSEFVVCGESVGCTSHKPVEVTVKEGQTSFDIEPTDWYL